MATKNLNIGSVMPAFNLKGIDGSYYNNDFAKNKKATVIIFSCNHCPYVQAYEDRIIVIQNKYSGKGVSVVAINSNDDKNYPDDSFEEMIKRAKLKYFNFPYLRDEDQSVAKAFDAAHTPEVFLFDSECRLAYHGKIDDNWKEPDRVEIKYLENAIEEILAGKEISVSETFSIGCTIKWKS